MSGQRHRKHVRLRPPARAVAGHATHTLSCISFSRKPWARAVAGHATHILHHANAEVICHLQPSFQLVESVWNNFRQVAFWNITTFCHRQMGQYFRFLSYLCPGASYMIGVWFDCLPFQKIRSTNERNQAQPLAAIVTGITSSGRTFISFLDEKALSHANLDEYFKETQTTKAKVAWW